MKSFTDERIKLIQNCHNRGIAWSLNHGINIASGDYIARMDGDDICHPKRLNKQYQFMERHPQVSVVGTWVRYFGSQFPVVERTPVGPERLKAFMLFGNPLYHPTVMMRVALIKKHGFCYDNAFHRTEDFELWSRLCQYSFLDNIPEPLIRFRWHSASVSQTNANTMKEQTCTILERGLRSIGVRCSPAQLQFHYMVAKGSRMESKQLLQEAEQWLFNLIKQNEKKSYCNLLAFQEIVGKVWFRLCLNSAQLGACSWFVFKDSELADYFHPALSEKFRFLSSILYNRFICQK